MVRVIVSNQTVSDGLTRRTESCIWNWRTRVGRKPLAAPHLWWGSRREPSGIACTRIPTLIWPVVKQTPNLIDKFVSQLTRVFLRVEREGFSSDVVGMGRSFWVNFHFQVTAERSECAFACFLCGVKNAGDDKTLSKCGKCKVVMYCSLSCQKLCVRI